ncbi:MAG: endolytic transglycosylase MltG [Lachnospiraceae bacterium]|nr:endolytic transglycosylase MltG [Lachnospiraceae bacterium]
MRFKYYLKGLGMGIIITTIIMTVSCVMHNNNLSDEEIIKKAIELGMVMPDSENESTSGLFGNNDKESSESENDSDSEGEPQSGSESEIEPNETEIPSETESSSETETPSETEIPNESESSSEIQPPSESENPTESEEPSTQTPPQHVEITQYVLHIQWGDTPRMIANELFENGMIDSASKFRKYLADNKYAGKLRSGTYTITKGMTYEEIAKMITKK